MPARWRRLAHELDEWRGSLEGRTNIQTIFDYGKKNINSSSPNNCARGDEDEDNRAETRGREGPVSCVLRDEGETGACGSYGTGAALEDNRQWTTETKEAGLSTSLPYCGGSRGSCR